MRRPLPSPAAARARGTQQASVVATTAAAPAQAAATETAAAATATATASATPAKALAALALLAAAGAAAAAASPPAAHAAATALGAEAAEAAEFAAAAALRIPGLVGDSQSVEGFVQGLLLIFFSEIGDKTFFIALLLALRRPRGIVFAGTFGALAAMTVISVALGRAVHALDALGGGALELRLPGGVVVPLDDGLAIALLVYFGLSTLRGAAGADARAEEEREEADEAVEGLLGAGGKTGSGGKRAAGGGGGGGGISASSSSSSLSSAEAAAAAAAASAANWALVASTFGLVFAAEWGDKSFLATIALAAAGDPAGVTAGAVAGHGVATGIAVAGGSALRGVVSEKTAGYVGGSLFLVFAAATAYDVLSGAH